MLIWWRIPSLAPAERVLRLRRGLLIAVAVAVFSVTATLAVNGRDSAWWASAYGIVVCLYGYAEFFHLSKIRKRRRDSAAPFASPAPVVVTARRLPRAGFGALVRSAMPLGGNVPLALVRSWTGPATERPDLTAAGSLRADRRACVAYGLAWTPAGVLLGLLGGGPGAVPWPTTLIVVLAHAAAAWLFGAALGRAYPLLRFTEVALGAPWWRGGLVGLLEDAADRGLLSRAGSGYAFTDAALRASTAATTTRTYTCPNRPPLRRRRQPPHGIWPLAECLTRLTGQMVYFARSGRPRSEPPRRGCEFGAATAAPKPHP